MLLSMTGFGKAMAELPNRKITVEIKSLNSKQLDLSMRLSAIFREKEMEMRNYVARNLERGKVEANIFIESTGTESAVQLNLPLLEEYKKQIMQMAGALDIPEPADWYSVLLRMPDAMKSDSGSQAADETDFEAVSKALAEAVEHLLDHRRAEGKKLEDFFALRIGRIRDLLAQIPQYETQRVEHIRSRIEDHLSSLPAVDYDRSRLEQEMIFYIEKLDINEEKQRLAQHLDYFIETMNGNRGQGKKLGFIAQEMGREINTLGSKSNHADMQRLVVKMKDELEQIKEQVLNVM
ncbi:MAG: YicC family protein [Bacteroides sp.]|nr:YicC family protein [Bacteroides sp.]MCM1413370.1 YicC family protein [Bacteroides sp.]MCM1471944.1 YicC family protein [Bacteroides sp.]